MPWLCEVRPQENPSTHTQEQVDVQDVFHQRLLLQGSHGQGLSFGHRVRALLPALHPTEPQEGAQQLRAPLGLGCTWNERQKEGGMSVASTASASSALCSCAEALLQKRS